MPTNQPTNPTHIVQMSINSVCRSTHSMIPRRYIKYCFAKTKFITYIYMRYEIECVARFPFGLVASSHHNTPLPKNKQLNNWIIGHGHMILGSMVS